MNTNVIMILTKLNYLLILVMTELKSGPSSGYIVKIMYLRYLKLFSKIFFGQSFYQLWLFKSRILQTIFPLQKTKQILQSHLPNIKFYMNFRN